MSLQHSPPTSLASSSSNNPRPPPPLPPPATRFLAPLATSLVWDHPLRSQLLWVLVRPLCSTLTRSKVERRVPDLPAHRA
eukprot:882645-Rhodomonas_salina.1